MCGIAGISLREDGDTATSQAAVDRMVAALRHRGPDDCGVASLSSGAQQAAPQAIIGATRLAILDLSSAGHQPMRDPETGNCLVLNGEIYNHWDLRREIGDRAGAWRSTSDTETVLKAFRIWGRNCIGRLRGMFAFALWDAQSAELWCGRDRLGIKPFYFVEQSGKVAFASEIRPLLAAGLAGPRIDERGLAGYVKFGSLPEPGTLIEGVRSLAAGDTMRMRRGSIVGRETYWSAAHITPQAGSPDPKDLRQALERVVREHLISDVPVATFLSGGIDSSVVTALAAQNADRPIRTFTVCFEQPEFDESPYAKALAQRYSTVHHEIRLSEAEVLAGLPKAVEALDLPSADALNTYIVSRAVAAAGVKVALSGLGGDELFGGYTTFRLLPRFEKYAGVLGRMPAELRRYRAGGRSEQATRREVSFQYRYESMRAFWSEGELRGLGVSADAGFGQIDPGQPFSLTARTGMCELQGYMRSTLLRDSDCMSMAHSLELRVPLLDHLLVEYCLRHNAAAAGTKRALLAATEDLLPAGAALRPKKGFVLPMHNWMRGPLRDYVRAGVEAATRTCLPRLSPDKLLEDFAAGRIKHSRVWQFVVLGHWVERHPLAAKNSMVEPAALERNQ
ncbi:MAG: asparagine synthase (glutamine-hydrolyzing) [Acidobacteria bacterium]|nr:asparagine synthase (glutamine-hydrolyzing) [Acidobacteriota bacterium]